MILRSHLPPLVAVNIYMAMWACLYSVDGQTSAPAPPKQPGANIHPSSTTHFQNPHSGPLLPLDNAIAESIKHLSDQVSETVKETEEAVAADADDEAEDESEATDAEDDESEVDDDAEETQSPSSSLEIHPSSPSVAETLTSVTQTQTLPSIVQTKTEASIPTSRSSSSHMEHLPLDTAEPSVEATIAHLPSSPQTSGPQGIDSTTTTTVASPVINPSPSKSSMDDRITPTEGVINPNTSTDQTGLPSSSQTTQIAEEHPFESTLVLTDQVPSIQPTATAAAATKSSETPVQKTDQKIMPTTTVTTAATSVVPAPSPAQTAASGDASAGKSKSSSASTPPPVIGKPEGTGMSKDASHAEANKGHPDDGLTRGGKAAIGIIVALSVLGLLGAGLLVYRRYNFTHRSLKAFLTSDVQYKTYNNATYKDDEGMLIMPDRR